MLIPGWSYGFLWEPKRKMPGKKPWGSTPWEFGTKNLQAIAAIASHFSRRNALKTGKKKPWFFVIFPSNPSMDIHPGNLMVFHAFLNMSGAFSMVSWTVKSHVSCFNPHFSMTDYLMIWAANSCQQLVMPLWQAAARQHLAAWREKLQETPGFKPSNYTTPRKKM